MFKAMFLIQYSAIKRGDIIQMITKYLNELRIEVAKQKENIDSLRTNMEEKRSKRKGNEADFWYKLILG